MKGGEQGEEGRRRVIIILISAPFIFISNRMKKNMSKQSLLKTHCKKSSFYIISLEIVRRQIHKVPPLYSSALPPTAPKDYPNLVKNL